MVSTPTLLYRTHPMSTLTTILEKITKESDIRRRTVTDTTRLPTLDVAGRLHAPHDGYDWNGRVYMAGEYIGDNTDTTDAPVRIPIRVELLPILYKYFPEGKPGKSWKSGDVDVCYFYALVPAWQKKIIESCLPIKGKRVVLVEEYGSNGSKEWKFSYNKSVNSCMKKADFEVTGAMHLMTLGGLDEVPTNFEPGRKKAGKLQERWSPWDGKLVRYEYCDGAIHN